MRLATFDGRPLPGPAQPPEVPGALVVVEGTDSVGRTTQVAFLKEWLEAEGYAVADTGLMRSRLAGDGLRRAKEGNTLGPLTMDLLYATDFADRLENEVIPALRAGFVVLSDRYIWSLMARAIVRGADPDWIHDVYGLAVVPSAVFYLKVDLKRLIPRVLGSGGFDYWESGMDFLPGVDLYQSYVEYQTRMLKLYDEMAEREKFIVVDANQGPQKVYKAIQKKIEDIVEDLRKAREEPAPLPTLPIEAPPAAAASAPAPPIPPDAGTLPFPDPQPDG
ncbi:MAG: thymidylate kinase [Planctomycetales bacterium]|nr:thymidylate kinase [Planctomycetales bacterium]